MNSSTFLLWKEVRINKGFWKQRQEVNEQVTLPAEYEQCKITGRIDSVKCVYRAEKDVHPMKGVFTIDGVLAENISEGDRIPRPHHYWDSDLAKWIEAASYSLYYHPDDQIEKQIDEIVDDYEKMQQPDGYLNTYYTIVEPGRRWTNVHRMHELYCAGHLIEAAVAYYQTTGKRKFLEIVSRYADCIDKTFGPEEEKIHGYPGHQEIELALVKLYKITGEEKYLRLAKYFIDERGKKPYFFEEEARKYGRDIEDGGPKGILGKGYLSIGPYALFQAHLPVREQKTAEGHAVRLTYMGCAMADLASQTQDEGLWRACKLLWENVTLRRMYITGGVGTQDGCERFNFDYHLPNEEGYQETCASVGMVMWAARMLQMDADGSYADIMERALYNGVLSGVSLDGDTFFYANHLSAKKEMFSQDVIRNPRMFPVRQKWFAVSCCPMNLARLIESLGSYIYSANEKAFFIHLFVDSETRVVFGTKTVSVKMQTEYPWDSKIVITVNPKETVKFCLGIRIPRFSADTNIYVDGEKISFKIKKGYVYIERTWATETEITIDLKLKPIYMEANPQVRMDAGKVALQYGPLVYCLEEIDNGEKLAELFVDTHEKSLRVTYDRQLLGGVCVIEGQAWKKEETDFEEALYLPIQERYKKTQYRAIPYYAWSNREPGDMEVWINRMR